MTETIPEKPAGADAADRRPIAARHTRAAAGVALWLTRRSVSPNAISLASIAFSVAGAAALLSIPAWRGPLLCAVAIQARLLCNLFDGMVAVEGGKSTPAGALFNEVPDRIADSVLLIALGYVAGQPWLGWLAALAAALTAYVRVLGGSLNQAQDFRGPMAKQHRMAVMTLACIVGAFMAPASKAQVITWTAALALIAVGALITCWTRLRAIARRLEAP